MGFLIDKDYDKQIRDEVLKVVKQDSDLILKDAEEAAISQMVQYLSVRFDTAKIFIDVSQWNGSDTYTENQMVWREDATGPGDPIVRTYYAKQGNTGEDPLLDANEDYWVEGDLRNPVIKMKAVDIVLYHLHSNVAHHQMNRTREDRYKMCIQWLKELRDGILNDPTLPLLEDEDGNPADNLMTWGSQPKRNDSY